MSARSSPVGGGRVGMGSGLSVRIDLLGLGSGAASPTLPVSSEQPVSRSRPMTARPTRPRTSAGQPIDDLGAGELGGQPAGDQQLGPPYAGPDHRDLDLEDL